MRRVDTLFYSERGIPLQPLIEEVLEDGSVLVSILPGLLICPNLKQKFVPIVKKELFTCKAGDSFYLVIDGNLKSLPVSINEISIKKMPEIEGSNIDPSYVLLARVLSMGTGNETDEEPPELMIENLGNFYKYNQLYLDIFSYEIEKEAFVTTGLL
jgi:hypothetical protein